MIASIKRFFTNLFGSNAPAPSPMIEDVWYPSSPKFDAQQKFQAPSQSLDEVAEIPQSVVVMATPVVPVETTILPVNPPGVKTTKNPAKAKPAPAKAKAPVKKATVKPAVKAPAVKAPAVKAPAVKAPAVKAPAVKAPAKKSAVPTKKSAPKRSVKK